MGNGSSLACEFKGSTNTMEVLQRLVTTDELKKEAHVLIEANAELRAKVIDNVQGEENYKDIFSHQGADAWEQLNKSANDDQKEELARLLEPYLAKTA